MGPAVAGGRADNQPPAAGWRVCQRHENPLQKLAHGEALIRRMATRGSSTRPSALPASARPRTRTRRPAKPRLAGRWPCCTRRTSSSARRWPKPPGSPSCSIARALVDDLVGRAQRQAAAATADDQAAAEALISALAAGQDPPPVRSPNSDLDTAEATAAELRTARAALAKLEAESTVANDRLARCRAGVQRSALGVLADQGADLAAEIIADQAALDQRHGDLDQLGRLLTSEGRRLNGAPPALPAVITRALYPAAYRPPARPLAASDWRAAYQALIEDPDASERY